MSENEGAAGEVRRRREALSFSREAFAERVGISRETLSKVEGGAPFRPSTMRKIRDELARLERALDADAPDGPGAGIVEMEVQGADGLRYVVRGPVADRAELESAIIRLSQQITRPGTSE